VYRCSGTKPSYNEITSSCSETKLPYNENISLCSEPHLSIPGPHPRRARSYHDYRLAKQGHPYKNIIMQLKYTIEGVSKILVPRDQTYFSRRSIVIIIGCLIFVDFHEASLPTKYTHEPYEYPDCIIHQLTTK
jgi:hypothetical protein